MGSCACGPDCDRVFDRRSAERDRDEYHRDGPDATTRMLLVMIGPRRVVGATVLDIGGGIGVIDVELLKAGAGHATLVDASAASLAVARDEARRANVLDRLDLVEGDFLARAPDVDAADIVTLHRVVCCYRDGEALVAAAAVRARALLALVLPRDRWLIRAAFALENLAYAVRGIRFRAYVHRNDRIDQVARAHGLRVVAEDETFVWRVVTYARGS